MQRQNLEIKRDPLFTPKFYEYKTEAGMEVAVSFPLPASPAALPEFLGGQTETSQQFKAGFAGVIDELAAWAKENGLSDDPLGRFKSIYLEYTGSHVDKNRLDFHIYHEGISSLSGIATQLKNDDLPLDARKDVMANLLKDINVCGPGSYTNIQDAYLALLSLLNTPMYWMALRRHIAAQVVLELFRAERVLQGMEIHYVNGVLNRFSDDLGILMVEDGYVANCNPTVLDRLFEAFKKVIPEKLNLAEILKFASRDGVLENLASRLEDVEHTMYAENVKKINNALARFGTESPDKSFFLNESSIIKLYGEYEDQIAVDWKANYIVLLSIYSRLQANGYINLEEQEEKIQLTDEVSLCRLPHRSLRFAYVSEEKAGKLICKPFISYCVEALAEEDSPQKTAIWKRLLSDDVSDLDRYEVAMGIVRYLNAIEAKPEAYLEFTEKEKELALSQQLIEKFLALIKSGDQLAAVLERLPADKRGALITRLGDGIQNIIEDGHDLASVLKHLPEDNQGELIISLGDGIKNIIQSSSELVRVLKKLSEDDQRALVANLGDDVKNIIKVIKDGYDLAWVLYLLSKDKQRELITRLGDGMKSFIQDGDQLACVLSLLPEDKQKALMTSLGSGIKSLIQDSDQLASVLKHLPEDNQGELIISLGDGIKNIIQSNYELLTVLKKLPEDQRGALIISLGDEIQNIIQDDDDLSRVFKKLPSNQWGMLISSLGDGIKNIIKKCSQLIQVLRQLPENKRGELIVSLGDRIKNIIKDIVGLAHVFYRLPEDKRGALISSLDGSIKDFIKDGDRLAYELMKLPEDKREGLVTSLRDVIKNIIQDGYDLACVLFYLPEDKQGELIVSMGDGIKNIIQNDHQLADVLDSLPEDNRGELIISLGEGIKNIIKYGYQLLSVLESLPEDKQGVLIASLGDSIKNIIKDDDQLVSVLNRLPADHWGTLITNLGDGIKNIIKDNYDLTFVLNKLPEGQWEALMTSLLDPILVENNAEVLQKRLDIFSFGHSGLIKPKQQLSLRQSVLNQLLEKSSLDLLRIAYQHPYFSDHRDITLIRGKINAMFSFFNNPGSSLIETTSQKRLKEKIETLEKQANKPAGR